MEDIKIM